ncbi:hypothetical protein DLAC_11753 [Tieghemostelium lacteum]|uniref:Helicase C-terminal domain-containing protein n=1 Tax=Tieghemostelium lacteum TaxID=361077 RepID=A0A151Z8S7_TIELA|nr:hypothetical protein DLAC_11753 [Tieghemostelium lacteum]|eukprot:KYQ90363.1 hypothetical protein DLAC_11753 [Tieghemostelium lacteum]
MSTDMAAFGINLTAANYIFIMDPIWSISVEQQAIARAQRIGQKKQVYVEKIMISNSLDDYFLKVNSKHPINTNDNSNNNNLDLDIEQSNDFLSSNNRNETESKKVKYLLKNLNFIKHPFLEDPRVDKIGMTDLENFIEQLKINTIAATVSNSVEITMDILPTTLPPPPENNTQ